MEKEYSYIWRERDIYFYIDAAGYIIKETDFEDVQHKNYPVIVNNSNFFINNNRIALEKKYLDSIPLILNVLADKEGIEVENFTVDQEIDTIKAKLMGGPAIFFAIDSDIEKQVNKLLVLKNERLKNDFAGKEYIDVRYGDSIYFK
jgi:hypothetical protein